jgi:glycosyltransferase involved in cell wall biosynthesis
MPKLHLELLIIIPALNEKDSLRGLSADLQQQFGPNPDWQVYVVDDGSTDGTWQEILRLHRTDSRISGIRLSRNFGKDAAILAGLNSLAAKCYIVMDGDGQHPATVARLMFDRWRAEGWDVINGIKRDRSADSPTRRLFAWIFNQFFHRLSGIDLTNGCDFKLLSHRTVQSLLQCPEYDFFFRAMVSWVGYRQSDIPFDVESRIAGKRSWTLLQLSRYAVKVLIQHSSLPLTFIFALGLFSLAGSSLLLGKLMFQYIFFEVPAGYPTIVALLLVSLSVNVIVVGVLGLYIRKIFAQSNGRPRFIVESDTGQAWAGGVFEDN